MGLFARLSGKSAEPDTKNATTRTTAATADRIKNVLGIRQLESMPSQAARAFQLASDPNAKGADFVKVIESDEIISARIVRVANSVYFFRGTPANDIDKAVANIGLDELRCLLSASMLKSLLQGRHPAREQIWANGVGTAICCRALSRFTNISEGEAFLCGLLHDVGKLVMIRRGGELYDRVIRKVGADGKTFIEAEEEIFELNHVEVGKWVGEVWSFPKPVIQAIEGHHEPWTKDSARIGKGTSRAMLVKAADTIAHFLGIGHPPQVASLRRKAIEELPHALKQLGISTKDGDSFIQNFDKQFDEEFSRYQLEEFQS
ncbi:MAG: HDOD domain-containing protein [Bdellovibrionota bacterium]